MGHWATVPHSHTFKGTLKVSNVFWKISPTGAHQTAKWAPVLQPLGQKPRPKAQNLHCGCQAPWLHRPTPSPNASLHTVKEIQLKTI